MAQLDEVLDQLEYKAVEGSLHDYLSEELSGVESCEIAERGEELRKWLPVLYAENGYTKLREHGGHWKKRYEGAEKVMPEKDRAEPVQVLDELLP